MKRNAILTILLLCCTMIMFTACTEEQTTEQHLCVKCGDIATTSIAGPAYIIQQNGISLSDCELVGGNIYSAHICEDCLGPVVTGPFM